MTAAAIGIGDGEGKEEGDSFALLHEMMWFVGLHRL